MSAADLRPDPLVDFGQVWSAPVQRVILRPVTTPRETEPLDVPSRIERVAVPVDTAPGRAVDCVVDDCPVQFGEAVGVLLHRRLGKTTFNQFDRERNNVVAALAGVLAPVNRLYTPRPFDRVAPARIRAGRRGPAGSDYAAPACVVESPFGAVCPGNRTDSSQPHPVTDHTGGRVTLAPGLDLGPQERIRRCSHNCHRAISGVPWNPRVPATYASDKPSCLLKLATASRLGLTGRNTQSRKRLCRPSAVAPFARLWGHCSNDGRMAATHQSVGSSTVWLSVKIVTIPMSVAYAIGMHLPGGVVLSHALGRNRGPVHLAAARQKAIVGVYSPTSYMYPPCTSGHGPSI